MHLVGCFVRSTSHCEINGRVSNSEWWTIYRFLNLQLKNIMNDDKEREISCPTLHFNFNVILNDHFGTQKWQICYISQYMLENTTVKLTAHCNSCKQERMLFFRVDLHGQQHPKCERAISLMYSPVFFETSLYIQQQKRKSNGVSSRSLHSCSSVIIQNEKHVHMKYFSQDDQHSHLPK
jgi:hypothetical protein